MELPWGFVLDFVKSRFIDVGQPCLQLGLELPFFLIVVESTQRLEWADPSDATYETVKGQVGL